VVDRLQAVALAAFGPDLEPRDVDVRQRAQELEPHFAVREAKLAREICSTDADRCRIELEPEQIRRRLRCTDELIDAEQPVILLAVKQRSEPTLDRDEPVRVGPDRDPVRRAGSSPRA
jgi:hypothetical protein